MTRFARAKGSKSSNERKPEEATSWSEMRNSMLSRKSNQREERQTVDEPKVKISTPPKKTEWASLGDDTLNESVSLLKQHLSKKNDVSEEIKKGKKKQRKMSSNGSELTKTVSDVPKSKEVKRKKKKNNEDESNQSDNDVPKQEKKKKKKRKNNENELNQTVSDTPKIDKKKAKKETNFTPEGGESEIKANKKGKKRRSTEGDADSETLSPKKKKKLQKTESAGSSLREKTEQRSDNPINETKKHENMNKGMKSKNFRKESDLNSGFKSKKGRQFERGKKFKDRSDKERKPQVEELIINGEKIPITKFQGFYVTVEDAERLKKLRGEMIKEGIPRAKLEAAIKLERRRAEKALSRLKKSVCFHCRGHGHLLSSCPNLLEKENTGTGICYKCGSTEHSAIECKVVRGTNYQFAECFICKEQGHIARQCPDNPRGLYPQGGACRECGDVTHLRKDCPKVQAQKAEDVVTVGVRRDRDLECLDEEIAGRENQNSKKKVKKSSTVKF